MSTDQGDDNDHAAVRRSTMDMVNNGIRKHADELVQGRLSASGVGGTVGELVGGPVGGAVGTVAGAAVDKLFEEDK
jgi:outer membrane lipoprotein SlyB